MTHNTPRSTLLAKHCVGFLLAVGFVGFVMGAHAQSANATHPKANKTAQAQANNATKPQSGNSTALLDDAYATLAQAKHDYLGHRVRAMKQIELALGEAGGKVTGNGRSLESQGTSDAQLRAAIGLLQQASAGLSKKALRHVDMAIQQLNTALAVK